MPTDDHLRSPLLRNPWLIALAVWLLLAAAAAAGLWHLRRDAVDSQARELGLLSLALTDEIDRGLRGAEEGLKALRTELQEGRLPLDGPAATVALHTRADLMPLVNTLWLVDRAGRVVAASDALAPPALSSFAPRLDALQTQAAAISRPFADPVRQETGVALAMPFQGPPTGPGETVASGWILAAVPASTLLGAFGAALPAADARMAVFRNDGVRLAGANVPAASADEAGLAERLAQRPNMEVRQFKDGSQNLVGLHSVPRHGIRVAVSRDLSAVLSAWQQAADVTAVALLGLLAVLAAAVHFVTQAKRRHRQAEQALQAQLSRASKLESLGTLAGGVAHDFNNVLAGIVGHGEMAQDGAEPGSDQARHIGKVLQAALRGKSLVERILAFSRGGARTSTVFELAPVVEEALGLLAGALRPGIVLERALDAPGGRLKGDPTQAFEAVMNLCTNALQAMPGGGMLSVGLQRERVRADRVLSHSGLKAGDYLVLSVTDQGSGITPAVMNHLFEPFFTTRSAESGTGLGLAVVHGVVTEIGGAIDVQSRPGAGARFSLYFPESQEALPEPENDDQRPLQGRGRRLLVVDDEPELVGLTMELVAGLGYEPEGYTDAEVALAALRQRPRDFAAVVTDEVMPGLSGTQLTQALRRFEPRLPVLLISGYGGALLAQRAREAGVSRVLSKPLQRADLATALADLLR